MSHWKIHELPEKHRANALRQLNAGCAEEPMTAEKANILSGVGSVEFGAGGGVETETRTREVGHGPKTGSLNGGDQALAARTHSRGDDRPSRPFVSTDEAKLNKTERAFLDYLRVRRYSVGIQDVTFKLADDCRYTPDFTVWGYGGYYRLTCFEVKGFWREDARVKIKVAARQLSWVRFIAVQRVKNGWKSEEIKP